VTLLQALMRERRLTREQTIDVLERRARMMEIHDFALSLRQLDRWLAQEVGDPRAARCRVAEAEFGYRIERLLSAERAPSHAGTAITAASSPLEHFGSIADHLAQIDHETGARGALGAGSAVCRSVLAAAERARGRDRDECLRLAARCAELVGWFHQDVGSLAKAQQWTAKALDLADAADAKELIPYVLMRRSVIAAELGKADETLLLAESALRKSRHGTERALAFRQVAAAHAMKGDASAFRAAVNSSIDAIAPTHDMMELAPYCSAAYLRSEAGWAALVLGNAELAIDYLEPATRDWPSGQQRDRAICLARLALAHARCGDLERAQAAAATASQAAVDCGSTRFTRTLRTTVEVIRKKGGSHRAVALADTHPL
jgi:tetratricopeptide (TPR) repeat protein